MDYVTLPLMSVSQAIVACVFDIRYQFDGQTMDERIAEEVFIYIISFMMNISWE